MLSKRFLMLVGLLLPPLVPGTLPAIQILGNDPVNGTHDPKRHDRYYVGADKEFIGEILDLSGVTRAENGQGGFSKWATMISDNYFISATHFSPGSNNSPLTFYRDDDLSGDSWQTNIVSGGQQVAGSDLWIGQVESTPPNWVRRYPLVVHNLGFNSPKSDDVESGMYVIGKNHAPNPPPSVPNEIRVGRNTIDTVTGEFPPGGLFCCPGIDQRGALYFSDDQVDFAIDEAITDQGDSGGPSMVYFPNIGSGLTSVHHAVGKDAAFSYLIDDIVSAVPEPIKVVSDLTRHGDFNADFSIDGADFTILASNFGGPGDYTQGDLDGDGMVLGNDFTTFASNFGKKLTAPSDFDQDLDLDADDFRTIGQNWMQTVPSGTNGDSTLDGFVDAADFNDVAEFWLYVGSYPLPTAPFAVAGDFNDDWRVNLTDYGIFGQLWKAGDPLADLDGDGVIGGGDVTTMVQLLTTNKFLPVDITKDNVVDTADLAILLDNWQTSTSNGNADGDINMDTFVDIDDLSLIADYFGWGVAIGQQPLPLPVPEPSTGFGLMMLTLALVLRRRR